MGSYLWSLTFRNVLPAHMTGAVTSCLMAARQISTVQSGCDIKTRKMCFVQSQFMNHMPACEHVSTTLFQQRTIRLKLRHLVTRPIHSPGSWNRNRATRHVLGMLSEQATMTAPGVLSWWSNMHVRQASHRRSCTGIHGQTP